MDDLEIRVRCLEMATPLALPDRDVKTVVEIATLLYDFVKAPSVGETLPEPADKPRRGRKPSQADILS